MTSPGVADAPSEAVRPYDFTNFDRLLEDYTLCAEWARQHQAAIRRDQQRRRELEITLSRKDDEIQHLRSTVNELQTTVASKEDVIRRLNLQLQKLIEHNTNIIKFTSHMLESTLPVDAVPSGALGTTRHVRDLGALSTTENPRNSIPVIFKDLPSRPSVGRPSEEDDLGNRPSEQPHASTIVPTSIHNLPRRRHESPPRFDVSTPKSQPEPLSSKSLETKSTARGDQSTWAHKPVAQIHSSNGKRSQPSSSGQGLADSPARQPCSCQKPSHRRQVHVSRRPEGLKPSALRKPARLPHSLASVASADGKQASGSLLQSGVQDKHADRISPPPSESITPDRVQNLQATSNGPAALAGQSQHSTTESAAEQCAPFDQESNGPNGVVSGGTDHPPRSLGPKVRAPADTVPVQPQLSPLLSERIEPDPAAQPSQDKQKVIAALSSEFASEAELLADMLLKATMSNADPAADGDVESLEMLQESGGMLIDCRLLLSALQASSQLSTKTGSPLPDLHLESGKLNVRADNQRSRSAKRKQRLGNVHTTAEADSTTQPSEPIQPVQRRSSNETTDDISDKISDRINLARDSSECSTVDPGVALDPYPRPDEATPSDGPLPCPEESFSSDSPLSDIIEGELFPPEVIIDAEHCQSGPQTKSDSYPRWLDNYRPFTSNTAPGLLSCPDTFLGEKQTHRAAETTPSLLAEAGARLDTLPEHIDPTKIIDSPALLSSSEEQRAALAPHTDVENILATLRAITGAVMELHPENGAAPAILAHPEKANTCEHENCEHPVKPRVDKQKLSLRATRAVMPLSELDATLMTYTPAPPVPFSAASRIWLKPLSDFDHEAWEKHYVEGVEAKLRDGEIWVDHTHFVDKDGEYLLRSGDFVVFLTRAGMTENGNWSGNIVVATAIREVKNHRCRMLRRNMRVVFFRLLIVKERVSLSKGEYDLSNFSLPWMTPLDQLLFSQIMR
ncbi:uncharacterized protein BJ171DRAFT_52183 [Polychytrium aggregatum]|uniref:uncharacterized protein n=1 Tax=Polychytrium aggregatum TaxID=110093 RepID=UPI0022FE15D7|nr:uncharacterized protein BJ171DRAFT_52183 [Polychytrium aggregatum]KAI9205789.1 hypothetical protein BJ171DRAFT_52183 [Polychytrium aggregatum]